METAEEIDDATIVDSPAIDDDATVVNDGTLAKSFTAQATPPASSQPATGKERPEVGHIIQAHKKKLALGAIVLLLFFLVIILFSGESSKETTGSGTDAVPGPLSPPAVSPAPKPPVAGPAGVAVPHSIPKSPPSPLVQPSAPTELLLSKLLAVGKGKETDIFDIRTDKESYHIGHPMRFFFEADEPCYALIFTYTTGDELIQVFPNHYQASQFIQPDREYEIPDDRMGFDLKVTGPAGTDTVIALISSKPFDLMGSSFSENNPFLLLNAKDSFKIIEVSKRLERLQDTEIYNKTITYTIE